jgi:hypothetical protein
LTFSIAAADHNKGGRHFFVSRLNERDLVGCTIERAEHAVDPIARVAKYPAHAPFVHALDHEIADGLAHCCAPKFGVGRRSRDG